MAGRGLPKCCAIDLKKAFWHKDKDIKRKALWSSFLKSIKMWERALGVEEGKINEKTEIIG
jgi:hypothetical protein